MFNLAKIATFTPGEMKSYINDLIMERDYWNTLSYAKEIATAEGLAEGREKGMAEGREKGLAEGRAEATAEAVRKMLGAGMSIEQVSMIMEMAPEEVGAIKQQATI